MLGGSIRDDGPLPDVVHRRAAAADAMRAEIPGVAVALMLASTLHAIAAGNCLPAGVETFCVDINQAVVTKLADRGSHQALGIVTDVGPFLGQLADALCGDGLMAELAWGRRYLMCPPHHFGVLYEINPWMHDEVRGRPRHGAMQQWEGLVATLRPPGAEVVTMDPQPDGARPRVHRQRRHRQRPAVRAQPLPPPRAPGRDARSTPPGSTAAGFEVDRLPDRARPRGRRRRAPVHPAGGETVLVSGYSFRSDAAAVTALGALAGLPDASRCSWSTSGSTTSTSRSVRSTTAAPSAPRWAGTATAAR